MNKKQKEVALNWWLGLDQTWQEASPEGHAVERKRYSLQTNSGPGRCYTDP
jgi:hypothetical protein